MSDSKIDLEAYYTKDEAIALLIGLGDMRYLPINDNDDAHTDEIDIPPFWLEYELKEMYECAEGEYKLAIHENETQEVIEQKRNKFEQIKALIKKANICAQYFDDEVAKGDSSVLRVYKPKSNHTPHYTYKSICEWWEGVKSEIHKIDSTLLTENLLAMNKTTDNDPNGDGDGDAWPSELKRDNVYTTFAFLVEAFANTAPINKYKYGDKPNAKAIGEHLATLAKKANNNDDLSGQSAETIRKLIGQALNTKKRIINEKGSSGKTR